ncbi:MAG: bifunctional shikimate kinase/3-dehydroquinate synthase [Myxococcales bacterium]|nr:bifunctional shikimate kinase/3-dehydroquinate synthase [Myxococcales bacterium]
MTSSTILLAGAPGAGKSTVGKALSQVLRRPFIDLDELIEARAGKHPAQIITHDGEARFRALEDEAITALEGATGAVVSLGGGALTHRHTRGAARQLGPVVRLDVPRELLKERLLGSEASRPLVAGKLDHLLEERASTYAAVDMCVNGVGSPEEVAERIRAACQNTSVITSRFLNESTRILVGQGVATAVAGAVAHLTPQRPVLLITDAGVPEEIRTLVRESIAELYPVHVVAAERGEATKTWSFLGEVLESGLRHGCGRQSVVVALGGGAICDLGNLAASLLGRGAPSILVPTTLLSQIDASVGGKCAVNHANQRNSVGHFHPPREVITDVNLVQSLVPEEFSSGVAELIKMAVLGDAELFERLENDEAIGAAMVARAIELKAEVVARDPTERGERKTLNLGHTLGHALESAANFNMRHGEAVAMGIVATAWASVRKNYTSSSVAERIERVISRYGLQCRPESALLQASRDYIAADKKSDAVACDWIAIRDIGDVVTERLDLTELKRMLTEPEG